MPDETTTDDHVHDEAHEHDETHAHGEEEGHVHAEEPQQMAYGSLIPLNDALHVRLTTVDAIYVTKISGDDADEEKFGVSVLMRAGTPFVVATYATYEDACTAASNISIAIGRV